ncbi:Cytochrome b561 and DOMON domain-containing protein [Psidium guajava]|nr:Cytochrome b561 and DOMON domain-containing protein [Psidium guajava]
MRSVFFLGFLVFSFCISGSRAQTCRNYTFSNKNTYALCVDLPVLSSYLHWNYTPSTGTADVAFRHTGATTSRWISWAINPKGQRMVGCQALVAYMTSSGSMYAYTSSISSYRTDMPEGALSFRVPSISATYGSGEMTIFARLELGTGMVSVSQVWQEGPMSGPGTPGSHSTAGANMKSAGTLNFLSTSSTSGGASGSVGSEERRRNVHGVLNAVSWGVLMPLGVLLARYLKVFKSANPAWFYLHVTCQTSAYAVGVAGWVTGLRLGGGGSSNTGTHGSIGMALFILGTLQVFALLLRPKPDHKYRFYWNMYHHSCGYAAITLSIINVFLGLDILDPTKVWKRTYIVILIALGCAALIMEPVTWAVVIKRRRTERSQKHSAIVLNGARGNHDNGRSHDDGV